MQDEQHGRRVHAISGKSHSTLPLRSKSADAKPRRSSGRDPIGRRYAAAKPMMTSITIVDHWAQILRQAGRLARDKDRDCRRFQQRRCWLR